MSVVADVKALRLLCARCGREAEVLRSWSREWKYDETALWVRCHRNELVVIHNRALRAAQAATRPLELVDLQDISESAEVMFQEAEAQMVVWMERADMLEKFLRANVP